MGMSIKKVGDTVLNVFLFALLLGLLVQMAMNSLTLHVEVMGISMEPTLEDGAHGRSFTFGTGGIERGDIVVVSKRPEENVIKRVIGLPGDTLRYTLGILYINGELIEEPYIAEEALDESRVFDDIGPLTLGPEEYFIMGDNRAHSLDSRAYGAVKRSQIRSIGFVEAETDREFIHSLVNNLLNN